MQGISKTGFGKAALKCADSHFDSFAGSSCSFSGWFDEDWESNKMRAAELHAIYTGALLLCYILHEKVLYMLYGQCNSSLRAGACSVQLTAGCTNHGPSSTETYTWRLSQAYKEPHN
jgi:hypothetical protein